jgi:hypothetical protein
MPSMRKSWFAFLALLLALATALPAQAQSSAQGQDARPGRQRTQSIDREALFWSTVKDSKDPAYFEEYLKTYPNGTYAGLARLKLRDLGASAPPLSPAPAAKADANEAPLPEPAPHRPVDTSPAAHPLEGLWLEPRAGLMMVIERTGPERYVMKEAMTDDKNSRAGDIIGEFAPKKGEAGAYVGRHIQGGRKKGDVVWSKEGDLTLREDGPGFIFLKYLGTPLQNGWTYQKVERPKKR